MRKPFAEHPMPCDQASAVPAYEERVFARFGVFRYEDSGRDADTIDFLVIDIDDVEAGELRRGCHISG